ncbi:DUF1190 domain-containing protein [Cronobacter dublinensis]|uniref:DUF1190 domain-containing protein n=1 Tax=Cronobacter dublinensis TaxID=413497 RepID=UPI00292FA6BE|nr:DUF1190 domain-containing protein [Cronobacter dublinensis]WNY82308.1 DUF1190 domain-containing protein [Cronobacter dublinensis]
MAAARKKRGRRKPYTPVDNSPELKSYSRPESDRKGAKILTLAIMGGAAFFGLKACQDDGDNDNDGDGIYYATAEECTADGQPADVCTNAWNTAKSEFERNIPTAKMNWDECSASYGNNCYYDGAGKTWVPMMAGFLLASNANKKRGQDDNPSTYTTSSTGYHYYYTRPVWQNGSGDYVWRGSKGTTASSSRSLVTRSATTISRGGFGRSSSSRSSWGG